MTITRPTCIALAALVTGCATSTTEIDPFIQSNKADGHPPKLHAIEDHEVDVDEPSDLAFAGSRLYTVSDAHSKIYGISRSGKITSEIDIKGNDLEALAFDHPRGDFLIADESRARIWHIDASGERTDPLDIEDAEDGNSGIEGMAFDPDGRLFVGKEKDPARIFVFDGTTEIDHAKLGWIGDLSALAFHDGKLFVLSDQDQALYQLDSNYDAEYAWRLPVDKPEGLAFDGSLVYVVSDSEQRLYVFDVDQ